MKNKLYTIISLLILSSCNNSLSFWDYKCTQDCSWHKAGYNWSRDKNIKTSIECRGKSKSFIEWCLQYIKDTN